MLFNSYGFILLFLPLVLIGYYTLGKSGDNRWTTGFLLLAGLCFVGYQSIYSLAVLLVNIFLNFVFLKWLEKKQSKGILALGIAFNLSLLFLFKYLDFFTENLNLLLATMLPVGTVLPVGAVLPVGTQLPVVSLILPLGISFYTFSQIAALADCYSKKNYEKYTLCEYACYVSFFPKLVQGPIAYHNEIIPGLRDKKALKINYDNMCKGIYAFALGLGKKVLLADTLAKTVNMGYNNVGALNSWDALLVMVCYSLQIYFDFSGYCDMAYGIGYLLNIKLPVNFNSPYKAESISDFWNRWHMTLTRFFTRYLYIPLGGSRKGYVRTLLNIMVVFLLSGLWHGANWTFILWGAFHGLLKVLERVFCVENWKLPGMLKRFVTFVAVTFGWSIFRADSLSQLMQLWDRLFRGGFGRLYSPFIEGFADLVEVSILRRIGIAGLLEGNQWILLAVFAAILVFACFFMKNTQEKVENLKLTKWKMAVTVVLMIWGIMSLSEISEFIYSNF